MTTLNHTLRVQDQKKATSQCNQPMVAFLDADSNQSMVMLIHAAANQSMVLLFDTAVMFDTITTYRSVAHPNAALPNSNRPDAVCHIDWSWFRTVFD